ncbi:MAG: OsmC family protein [Thermoplasmata archaeon]
MGDPHRFHAHLEWTGNCGSGTSDYRSYGREHVVRIEGKPDLLGSSAPTFRGDPGRWNPEELLVASLSACHMLWYLHFCATNGIRIVAYTDDAEGTMAVAADGSGRFTDVVLRPKVSIQEGEPARAMALHSEAHRMCFIAASVNFPVRHEAQVEVVTATTP